MINTHFESIRELVQAFPDQQACIDHLENLRWEGNVISPFDPSSKVYKCSGEKYRCKNSKKYFNVKTGTLFDNTRVPLQKWFVAIWLIVVREKEISSVKLGELLGVSQKTAWLMLRRIGECFELEKG